MSYIVRWNKKIVNGKEEPVTEEEIYEVYTQKKEITGKKEDLDKYLYEFDKEKVKELTLKLTGKKLRESISEDQKIINIIALVKDLDKIINILTERLREFYGLYVPELAKEENILDLIKLGKEKALASYGIKESVGTNFDEEDLNVLNLITKRLEDLIELRKNLLEYIDKKIKKLMPNFSYLATVKLAADFLEHSGSIEKLSKYPSSTIQVLGAEKALFLHLMKGTKPPKYGILYNHPLIKKLPYKQKGKAARALANKLSIAIKVDYNNLINKENKFIADKLKEELVKRFKVNW
jgi:nucleolar protein 56